MEQYESNSYKSREAAKPNVEKKRMEKVVTGEVTVKKKSEVRKFIDLFITEDMSKVKDYIVGDVIIPSVKKGIYDTFTNALDMMLYGEARENKSKNSIASKVSYRSYYDNNNNNRVTHSTSLSRDDYGSVIVSTRGEAEDVMSRLDEAIDKYGFVSVGDLYDLVGHTGSYTDNNYGWTDIRSAQVIRTREGKYMIKMPRALPFE